MSSVRSNSISPFKPNLGYLTRDNHEMVRVCLPRDRCSIVLIISSTGGSRRYAGVVAAVGYLLGNMSQIEQQARKCCQYRPHATLKFFCAPVPTLTLSLSLPYAHCPHSTASLLRQRTELGGTYQGPRAMLSNAVARARNPFLHRRDKQTSSSFEPSDEEVRVLNAVTYGLEDASP